MTNGVIALLSEFVDGIVIETSETDDANPGAL
jgi:hypothetical protein